VGERDATLILRALQNGEIDSHQAADELYPLLYQEIRRLAHGMMQSQRSDHTLQPTALVNEAFLKMVRREDAHYQDRAHFFRVAAKAMRQILVNYSRDRKALKRGGGRQRVTLDENLGIGPDCWFEVLALDEALTRLSAKDERMGRIIELRVFAGMTLAEAARVLGISPRTASNDWRVAKLWLLDELREGPRNS
jgi:RNA polymerase sigma factor (TIGR02999 family)